MYTVEFLGMTLEVNPIALTIGTFNIYWYGVIIATGFLAAMVYAFRRAGEWNIDTDPMVDVILIGTVGAVVCARAYYVLTSLDKYHSFAEALDIRDGGIAIYGGVIGAFVFGGLACKWRKIHLLDMFDLASIGFLLGQGVGRWGNFANQEAFGSNTTLPWGMYSNRTAEYLTEMQGRLAQEGVTVDPALPVHPCFLYESLWCMIGFVLLHFLSRRRHFKGETLLQYIIWYGLGRFFIEQVRTDSLFIGPLKISQVIAAVCVVIGLIVLISVRVKQQKQLKNAIAE